MPSETQETRKPRSHAAVARARAAVPPPRETPPDARTDARLARTREYMQAEHEREAALAKQGYWF